MAAIITWFAVNMGLGKDYITSDMEARAVIEDQRHEHKLERERTATNQQPPQIRELIENTTTKNGSSGKRDDNRKLISFAEEEGGKTSVVGGGGNNVFTQQHLSTTDDTQHSIVRCYPKSTTIIMSGRSRPTSRRQSNATGDAKRVPFEGIQEENSERHVKFNIDFNEWRRNTQSNLLSADTTFTSGLRRIRSSQVSLASLLETQPKSHISTSPTNQPLSAQHHLITSSEDLTKFPSESLHSFSFSQPRDPTAILESRQNVLRKSIDYMKDKLHGGAPVTPWSDQTLSTSSTDSYPLPKDEDVLQSLKRANLIPEYWDETSLPPPTAPITVTEDPFDSFETESLMMGKKKKKRSPTDLSNYKLQAKLFDAVTKPYSINNGLRSANFSPTASRRVSMALPGMPPAGGAVPPSVVPVHTTTKLAQTMQAIFSTGANAPWRILNANDLACLEFGVTEQEIKRGVSILEFFEPSRREWVKERLSGSVESKSDVISLGEDSSNESTRTESGGVEMPAKDEGNERVVLCGEVVSMRKIQEGGESKKSPVAASLWVKENKGAFIWVIEPISNAIATLSINTETEEITSSEGQVTAIFGRAIDGLQIDDVLPFLDRDDKGMLEWNRVSWKARYCANFQDGEEGRGYVPCTVEVVKTNIPDSGEAGTVDLRISYLPHIAGVLVLDAHNLTITSSNSAFSSALFGRRNLCGLEIGEVIPEFRRVMHFIAKEQRIQNRRSVVLSAHVSEEAIELDEDDQDLILEEGTVVPEHAFRRAEAMLEFRQASGAEMTPSSSYSGSSLSSESEVVEMMGETSLEGSEGDTPFDESADEKNESDFGPVYTSGRTLSGGLLTSGLLIKPHGLRGVHRDGGEVVVDVQMRVVRPVSDSSTAESKIYYALWITYSGPKLNIPPLAHLPPVSPEPPTTPVPPPEKDTFSSDDEIAPEEPRHRRSSIITAPTGVDAWEVIEDMGEGAYGSVKLVRHRVDQNRTAIMKYVTKARILVDTWTRDRVLGTVPLEIHILNFLKDRPQRNLCEMVSFFEDEKHYYVEMTPFGRPGTDLFDWIEVHTAMTEAEAKSIFHQTCLAIQHLHVECKIVHRDIKDENIVLDTAGRVKVIDFGSAAYLKDGPFDTFHGTLDYASPEVLGGKEYEGRGQDVWAAGILLYTMLYKENPFYNIEEILDRDLRIPYVLSNESIDLIQKMLERDLSKRPTISQVLTHPWFDDVVELDWTGVR